MGQRTFRVNWWAAAAAAGAVAYTVSKVHLAVEGRLGMPGFPAPEESYRQFGDVAAAQLGNAAIGAVSAVLALLLLVPMRRGVPRVALHVVGWLGAAMPAAGVVGFAARAVQVTDALGPAPLHPLAAGLALLVGAVWSVGWVAAILRHPVRVPATLAPVPPDAARCPGG